MKIKDRIIDFKRVKASSLHPHPRNWRTHPDSQKDALKGVLAEIGYADALVVRKDGNGFQILDGHLRAETTPDAQVPILVTDLNDDEADKFLVTHDPLGALATTDLGNLDSLLASVKTDNAALTEMIEGLAGEPDVFAVDDAGMPDLPSGDKSEYQQITFTLHDDQAKVVEDAIGKAKEAGFTGQENTNSNGNALHLICEGYLA